MQDYLEKQFTDLVTIGDKKHGTPWQGYKNGAITYSEWMLLQKAIREAKFTQASVIHAAKYAGKASITIKLR